MNCVVSILYHGFFIKIKSKWEAATYTVGKNLRKFKVNNIFWWGGVKAIHNWYFNDIWLSLHPINKYWLKLQFSQIFFLTVYTYLTDGNGVWAGWKVVFVNLFVCIWVTDPHCERSTGSRQVFLQWPEK